MEEKFDIILTSWNRLDYLKRTVASLISSSAIFACDRFIIVDNGSTESGVMEFLKDLQKNYRAFLVLLPENRGWGTAVNNALGLSRAPYLFVCNNDVEFSFEFYKKMLDIFEPNKWFTNQSLGILGVWRHTAHGLVPNGVHNEIFDEMDNVPAVGWMMPKSAMEKVGMLPEHGPCLTKGGNGEDTEYVNRMKEAGFLVGVPKQDIANHIDGY